MTCSRKDCPAVAVARPVLLLASALAPEIKARAELDLPLCFEHKAETTVEHLLTDDGWMLLETTFGSAGKAPPARDLTTITWEPIQ